MNSDVFAITSTQKSVLYVIMVHYAITFVRATHVLNVRDLLSTRGTKGLKRGWQLFFH